MYIEFETELDERVVYVEGFIEKGERMTHDYAGSPPEASFVKVYTEENCDITDRVSWNELQDFEDRLIEIYNER